MSDQGWSDKSELYVVICKYEQDKKTEGQNLSQTIFELLILWKLFHFQAKKKPQ